jgi:hypothetical protein
MLQEPRLESLSERPPDVLVLVEEGGVIRSPVDGNDLCWRESQSFHAAPQLRHEREVADGSVIGADGDGHACTQQPGEGCVRAISADTGLQVAGGTEVQADAAVSKLGRQGWIVDRRRTVRDTPWVDA